MLKKDSIASLLSGLLYTGQQDLFGSAGLSEGSQCCEDLNKITKQSIGNSTSTAVLIRDSFGKSLLSGLDK